MILTFAAVCRTRLTNILIMIDIKSLLAVCASVRFTFAADRWIAWIVIDANICLIVQYVSLNTLLAYGLVYTDPTKRGATIVWYCADIACVWVITLLTIFHACNSIDVLTVYDFSRRQCVFLSLDENS